MKDTNQKQLQAIQLTDTKKLKSACNHNPNQQIRASLNTIPQQIYKIELPKPRTKL